MRANLSQRILQALLPGQFRRIVLRMRGGSDFPAGPVRHTSTSLFQALQEEPSVRSPSHPQLSHECRMSSVHRAHSKILPRASRAQESHPVSSEGILVRDALRQGTRLQKAQMHFALSLGTLFERGEDLRPTVHEPEARLRTFLRSSLPRRTVPLRFALQRDGQGHLRMRQSFHESSVPR